MFIWRKDNGLDVLEPITIEVSVPGAGAGPTQRFIDIPKNPGDPSNVDHLNSIQLVVKGLSGCMGTICVVFDNGFPLKAMLMHDNTTGYFPTRSALFQFLNENKAYQTGIIWGMGKRALFSEQTKIDCANVSSYLTLNARESSRAWGVSGTLCCLPIYNRVSPTEFMSESTLETWATNSTSTLTPLPARLRITPQKERKIDSPTCTLCGAKSAMFKRHHCRNCNVFMCTDCTRLSGHNPTGTQEKYCKNCNPRSWSEFHQ